MASNPFEGDRTRLTGSLTFLSENMVSLEHIWSVNEKRLSRMERLGLRILKRFVITWECIKKNHIMSYASALTYSSMLAAVPVLAIIFAIA